MILAAACSSATLTADYNVEILSAGKRICEKPAKTRIKMKEARRCAAGGEDQAEVSTSCGY